MDSQRFVSIAEFRAISGLGRTRTYELLAQERLVAVKCGRRTLITVDSVDAYLNSLPRAHFTTGRNRSSMEVSRARA